MRKRSPARRHWELPGVLVGGILAGVLSAGCPAPPPNTTPPASDPAPPAADRAACCRQCLAASARDPAGVDLRIAPCSKYQGEWRGEKGVDPSCAQHAGLTVGACQSSAQ